MLRWFAIVGGVFGILQITIRFDKVLNLFEGLVPGGKRVYLIETVGQTTRPELATFVPYIAAGILGLMGLAFIIALLVLLTAKDVKENQARIKAADNIVKTFGGFFTGLATTLLK